MKTSRLALAILCGTLVLAAGAAAVLGGAPAGGRGGSGPGTGPALVADGPAPAGTLRLPAAHAGDAWSYHGSFGPGWGLPGGGEVAPLAALAWLAPERARLADGALHDVDVLRVHSHVVWEVDDGDAEAFPFVQETLVDPSTGDTLAYRGDGRSGASHGASANGIEVLTQAVEEGTYTSFADDPPNCLALRLGNVDPAEGLALPRGCTVPLVGSVRAGLLEATAGGHLGALEAVRFTARDPAGGGDTHLWLSPQFPYPVAFEAAPGTPEALTVTLAGFDQGDGALAPRPGRPGEPHTPALGPRQAWGPDDTGVDHPFPLSEAYAAALEDPAWPVLRSFLLSHPEAATVEASYARVRDEAGDEHGWRLVVSDGSDDLTFDTMRRLSLAGLPVDGPSQHRIVANTVPERFPSAAQLPAELPTVASQLSLWQAFAADLGGEAREADGYGFSFACDDWDCDAVRLVLWSGEGRLEAVRDAWSVPMSPANAWDPYVAAFDGAVLFQAPDGKATAVVDVEAAVGHDIQVGPPKQGTPVGPSPPDASGPVRSFLGPEATGVGLAATLVAAFVYFLPQLKAGAAALFSRTDSSRLLEQPVRARIHELVLARPGIHFQAITRELGLGRGTASHHLDKLVEGGLLRRTRAFGMVAYHPPDVAARDASAGLTLRSGGARRLLEAVRRHPGQSSQDAGESAGLSPAGTHHHVRRLQAAGLVSAVRDGKHLRLHATPRADAALA